MIMPDKIENIMFAPCGMDCMVCYVHLKKKKNCHGCLADDENKPERCKKCAIKNCAQEKGITFCYECGDFPCKKISNMEKSYTKRYQVSLLEQSSIVKTEGLERFFEKEAQRWRCPDCGGILSLHDKDCSECGKKI